jgi:hypothetical protein
MKITQGIRHLIDLGLVEPIDGRGRIVLTPLAKQELRTLLQRSSNLAYWRGVLSSYWLLDETELDELDSDDSKQKAVQQ